MIFFCGFHSQQPLTFLYLLIRQCSTLWNKIFLAEFGKNKKLKPKCVDELQLKMATVEVQDRAAGYWKWLYFRTVGACDMKKWKRHLGLISCHTGLPSQTERILR